MYCFFYGDFVEGVYGYFYIGEINVRVVCFYVNFNVVVNDLFDGYKNFYRIFGIFYLVIEVVFVWGLL